MTGGRGKRAGKPAEYRYIAGGGNRGPFAPAGGITGNLCGPRGTPAPWKGCLAQAEGPGMPAA